MGTGARCSRTPGSGRREGRGTKGVVSLPKLTRVDMRDVQPRDGFPPEQDEAES
jgi:hypothetical protein